jgi:hypothetical protein
MDLGAAPDEPDGRERRKIGGIGLETGEQAALGNRLAGSVDGAAGPTFRR